MVNFWRLEDEFKAVFVRQRVHHSGAVCVRRQTVRSDEILGEWQKNWLKATRGDKNSGNFGWRKLTTKRAARRIPTTRRESRSTFVYNVANFKQGIKLLI